MQEQTCHAFGSPNMEPVMVKILGVPISEGRAKKKIGLKKTMADSF